MEPGTGYENKTIIKTLTTSHLTPPFFSSISFPIQTFNPNKKKGNRDIEAITQCTFFKLIHQRDGTPFVLALIKDSSGAFAAFDALALKDWVIKKPINPLSQATITHTSLYAVDSILGQCEFLGSSESVQAVLSIVKNKRKANGAKQEQNDVQTLECQSEEIVKDLDISHLTKPFSSRIKFYIERYNPATKKQEMVIEALTKRSFHELIKTRESLSLSFVLALVEDCQGEFSAYDASQLNGSLSQIPVISPLKKEIRRISWYKIDRLANDFIFLGDSISAKARFIDSFIRANTGDVQAQYELGCMYAEGTLVGKDSNHAMHFFGLAARAGHLQAFLRMLPELVKEQKIKEIVDFFKTVKVEKVREIAVPYVDLFYTEVIPLKDIRYDLLKTIHRDESTYKVTYLRGKCHKEGVGTDKSLQRALVFFKEASSSCPKASYEMGIHALESKDLGLAKEYLIKAGKSHVPAQLLLVKLYLIPGDPNFKAAVKILNRLCEQKIKEAFMPLVDICMRGEGTLRNYERAYELLKRASEFDVTACYLLARELTKQKDSKFSFKPELGFKLIEKAIKMEPNDGRLYWLRFCCYRDGLGVRLSESECVASLMQGANLNDELCAESLGEAFYYGRYGLTRDLTQAVRFLRIAENQLEAQVLFAKIYSESNEPVKEKKAIVTYFRLSKQLVPLADYQLYRIYRDGLWGEKANPKRASDYLKRLESNADVFYNLQVGVDRSGDSGDQPEFSYSLPVALESLRSFIGVRDEIEALPQKISELFSKKDDKTERLIYLISIFALIPFFCLRPGGLHKKPGEDQLKALIFNEYKSRIEDFRKIVVAQDLVDLLFKMTQLFDGIYNLKKSKVDLKTLTADLNPILFLYKFCADCGHTEAYLLYQKAALNHDS